MKIKGICFFFYCNLYYIVNASILMLQTKCEAFCDEKGGICVEDICTCRDDYTSLSKENFKFCNYAKKKRLISAFMELFIGFGAGHFYCERTVNGFLKSIVFGFSCCCSFCLVTIGSKLDFDTNDTNHTAYNCSLLITSGCFILLSIWQLIDFIMFLCGVYHDGNGLILF